MCTSGTATVRRLLFINQGEQREASHFMALAKGKGLEPERRGTGSTEDTRKPVQLLHLVFSFPKRSFCLGENAWNIMLKVTLVKYSKYYQRLLDIIKQAYAALIFDTSPRPVFVLTAPGRRFLPKQLWLEAEREGSSRSRGNTEHPGGCSLVWPQLRERAAEMQATEGAQGTNMTSFRVHAGPLLCIGP